MIYLISDLHSDIHFKGLSHYIKTGTDDDLLIILGDIGLNFGNSKENDKFTEYFMSIRKNIALVDGNHENFEYLNSFEEEKWNGGTVGRLTPYIVHLKRGNIYTIEDKTFFVFGGCKSSPKWKEMGLWYPGDEPNKKEILTAYDNLSKYNYKVDYILTHKYEQNVRNVNADLLKLTEFIDEKVDFERWYAGHWHVNEKIDDKHILVYDELTKLF